jgi:UDP-2,3-diacylglucosamine hydrolase
MTLSKSGDSIFFISDAHLGIPVAGHDRREVLLFELFEEIRRHGSHLFIVGDLFDFWIEYRHAIRPDYFEALYHLKALAESGVRLHYCAGNHDFALGSFLPKQVGVHVSHDAITLPLQGKRVYVVHGDGVIARDNAYRMLRRVLRNPVNQFLYKLLHPNLGVGIAHLFSTGSRHIQGRRVDDPVLGEYRHYARSLLEKGNDIVVMGHTHAPELWDFQGKRYCNTGEWMRRHTYARMDDGKITLWEYRSDGSSTPIQPSFEK